MPTVVRPAATAGDYEAFSRLVREYVASLPFVLDFQDVEDELANLEAEYGPPAGVVLLAIAEASPEAVGCAAIRLLDPGPPPIAELKRMYLQPGARGQGIGEALAKAALEWAAGLGYERLRLDTVAELVEAAQLYAKLGFYEIAPYRHNPLPSARFYETTLSAAGSP